MPADKLPHLLVTRFFETGKYTYPREVRGKPFPLPQRDRAAHGALVRSQLDEARRANERLRGTADSRDTSAAMVLEFRSDPGFLLKLDGLESRSAGIEVACVRSEAEDDAAVQVAVVHVPPDGITRFLRRIEQYETENTNPEDPKKSRPKNQDLIESIGKIRLAALNSLWTAEDVPFPPADRAVWWEVWLRKPAEGDVWPLFERLIATCEMRVGTDRSNFPDRIVGLVFGSATQMASSVELLDLLAELRPARENPAPFGEMSPIEQAEWAADLAKRLVAPPADAPAVCILDHGVILHPLLRPALYPDDLQSIDPNWPLASRVDKGPETHGTEMAGAALFGDGLAAHLAGTAPVPLRHRLESVRILPPTNFPPNDPRLYGELTSRGAALAEIASPQRNRNYCLAVTTDGNDRGRPTAWSGAVDRLAAGIDDEHPRLFLISAGNTDSNNRHLYPDSNDTDPIQDPAQAWNALTVGAFTNLCHFTRTGDFAGHEPIAQAGDLSPSSTTSLTWFRSWPYKPDLVMEGGNETRLPGGTHTADPDELAILTTAHAATGNLFVDFRDTSAATAQAARLAAILQAEYPTYWPETIRGLLVHSAEWTDAMRQAFGNNKADAVKRLKRYGYGVPDLAEALHSARNSLTLIAQNSIRPFKKEGSSVKTDELGMHELPWPKAELLSLGATPVTMRVTLSYFIEPKPGRREGFAKYRHRYASHGLRFEVRRPGESQEAFRKRISKAAHEEGENPESQGDAVGWVIGPQARTQGSLHSDWWTGTAADLADAGCIAVYPVGGWWREAPGDHWKKSARYALLVSLRTEARDIDLYTPIRNRIELAAAIETPIEPD